jgi:hypothetical protein
MTDPVSGITAAQARAANALQAAYFRAVLAERRAGLDAHLDQIQHEIQTTMDTGAHTPAHILQRTLREQNDELRHLDQMIAAPDRRYSALWPREG